MRGHQSVNLAKSGDVTTIEIGNGGPIMEKSLSRRQQKKEMKRAALEEDINFSTAVWTTSKINKLLGNNENANIDFKYLTPSTTTATTPTNQSTSSSTDGNNTLRLQAQNHKNTMLTNNSTIKLLPEEAEDKPCKPVSGREGLGQLMGSLVRWKRKRNGKARKREGKERGAGGLDRKIVFRP